MLTLEQSKTEINNLSSYLKKLEKEEPSKPKVSRRKDIVKIKAEINETENRKTIEKIHKTESDSLKGSMKLINF